MFREEITQLTLTKSVQVMEERLKNRYPYQSKKKMVQRFKVKVSSYPVEVTHRYHIDIIPSLLGFILRTNRLIQEFCNKRSSYYTPFIVKRDKE